MTWLKPGDVFANIRQIGFVEEVCAVAAASLLEVCRVIIEHALAPFAIDALVVRTHERLVEHPGLVPLVIVETQPFMDVLWLWHLSDDS